MGYLANRSGKNLAIRAIYIMIDGEDRGGFPIDHTLLLLHEEKGAVMTVDYLCCDIRLSVWFGHPLY